jgi:hypothetical protein
VENDLANARADSKGHGRQAEVRELEGDLALESGVDETCGGVNEDRETADAAAALDASDEIVRNPNPLERRPERKLAWTKQEVGALRHLFDFPSEHDRASKLTAQTQVDAGGLKLELEICERIDDDRSVAEPPTKVAIG